MDRESVVVQENAREWEMWPDEEVAKKGLPYWKTLLSADLTHSEALTLDIAKIPQRGAARAQAPAGGDLPPLGRNRLGYERRRNAARRPGDLGVHTGQRLALPREHRGGGSTVRLRLSRENGLTGKLACRWPKSPPVGVRLSGLLSGPYRHTYDTGWPQKPPNHHGLWSPRIPTPRGRRSSRALLVRRGYGQLRWLRRRNRRRRAISLSRPQWTPFLLWAGPRGALSPARPFP
jgi:hypothetical protein